MHLIKCRGLQYIEFDKVLSCKINTDENDEKQYFVEVIKYTEWYEISEATYQELLDKRLVNPPAPTSHP